MRKGSRGIWARTISMWSSGIAVRTGRARRISSATNCLDVWYDNIHTIGMKTAVSIPDKIFRSADSLAKRLGVSRSRLYADALADFLSRRQSLQVKERLDAIYGEEESASGRGLGNPDQVVAARGVVMDRGEVWWAEPRRRRLRTRFSAPRRDRFRECVQPEPHPDRAGRGSHVESPVFRGPGNVFLAAAESGLPKDSVANVPGRYIGQGIPFRALWSHPAPGMKMIDEGLRLALSL